MPKMRSETEGSEGTPLESHLNESLLSLQVWRDVFADKEISELEVYCNRKEEGCNWQGKQALLKVGHLSRVLDL